MKTKEQLLHDIKMVSNNIKLAPNKPSFYFKRAELSMNLDNLNSNRENYENIRSDLDKAIELDNTNPTYKSTLMKYYASVGQAKEAIKVAVILDNELKSNPENVLEMSAKQTMESVLKMDEIWKEAQEHPEIQHLLEFLSPYVIKIQEHEVKITQAEVKISEHDKRFEQDEVKLDKLGNFITDIKAQLSHFATKKEVEAFDQKLNEEMKKVTIISNNPDINLTLKIDDIEKKLEPELVKYAKGYFQALESSIETIKIKNSHMVELTPYAKPIDNAINNAEGVVTNVVAMAPIVGPAVAAAISGSSAIREVYVEHRFDKRVDNFNSTLSGQHPMRANKELYLKILEGTQSNSTEILESIKAFYATKKELHKMHPDKSDYRAIKHAKAKAIDIDHKNGNDAFKTGLTDGFKLSSNLQKHPEQNLKLLDAVEQFFKSTSNLSASQTSSAHSKHPHLKKISLFGEKIKEKMHLDKNNKPTKFDDQTKVKDKTAVKTEFHTKQVDINSISDNTDKVIEKFKPSQDTNINNLSSNVHNLTLDDAHSLSLSSGMDLVGNAGHDQVHDLV